MVAVGQKAIPRVSHPQMTTSMKHLRPRIALEYDEYDALVTNVEGSGESCVTCLPEFSENMLSENVLKVDIFRYLEDNWPVDDSNLARIHKLYRLVAYQRCSRWIFQILGKKSRRPFPSCVYATIRAKFASPDGLYTHFKYSKRKKYVNLFISFLKLT